ncbi:tyrosine-type recombinase/integrase [Thermicanus aegyptius]|uniref:tyrosine-type recombinase/integrase n=1 Tax=Thermicanus aegyptius TaxID=94009 RepID=UPI0004180E31|nr:tyrosine-type recombinase/integrase [Thermicanus aegyptius]
METHSIVKEFLEWSHNEGKDVKTIAAYKTVLTQFMVWIKDTEGEVTIDSIKPITVKEYLSYLTHTLNRKKATVNKAIASLKTFFAYLVETGVVEDNPMVRIKIQKVRLADQMGEKGVPKWLTKEEQERYISYVELEKNEWKRIRNLAIIDLMLYAGLRVSEVVDLKVEDVKIDGDIIVTIREGKGGQYATVVLIKKYSRNLKKWLKIRSTHPKGSSPYLFVSERSGKFTARGIQVMLNKYAGLAGMEKITPHRFRHSFCKNLANAGVNIETIRRLARHENIQTTAIYIDPSHEEQMRALEKM